MTRFNDVLLDPDFILIGQRQGKGVALVLFDGENVTETVVHHEGHEGAEHFFLNVRASRADVAQAKTWTAALQRLFGKDARLVPRRLKWRRA